MGISEKRNNTANSFSEKQFTDLSEIIASFFPLRLWVEIAERPFLG
jgi:hypothetical protein